MTLRPTLIFDLDNTLVECKAYYDSAIEEFAARKADYTGFSPEFCKKILADIDLASCQLPGGFSRDRFPRSFRSASVALDVIADYTMPDLVFADEMYDLGNAVFIAPYTLYEGITDALELYKQGGWHIAMCSKGEDAVQWYKINKNNLGQWFATSAVYITLKKSPDLLKRIACEQQSDPERTWVIGDSPRDDIGPAKVANFGAVEVVNKDGTWGYESEAHEPHARVAGVAELSIVIPYDANHSSAYTAELRRGKAGANPVIT